MENICICAICILSGFESDLIIDYVFKKHLSDNEISLMNTALNELKVTYTNRNFGNEKHKETNYNLKNKYTLYKNEKVSML